jgi:protein-L-isoaspartate(D-aspartate) O-methyltransferase
MVDESIAGAGVKDPRVLKAALATPRHEFVSAQYRAQAYFDMALPIGESQTISSPFIVAYMTETLNPQPTDRVLEIGTGSGYQAAILSPLVKEVYTIEIVEPLGLKAERTLKRLNYTNVFVKVGDGFLGWPEHAPFDKIVVTCSPEKVPQPLIDQLAEGGLMVIPVGERYQQVLNLLRKKSGKLEVEALQPTLFVPMTGAAEARRQVRPDASRPRIVNGNFEQPTDKPEIVPGFYYERQVRVVADPKAPEGGHYLTFHNQEPGRSSHVLQGFPVDGQVVGSLEFSLRVKSDTVQRGRARDEEPMPGISFYDQNRKDLGFQFVGPFLGSSDWQRVTKTIRVPPTAREAILRIGLFGATGEFSVDDVRIQPAPR